MSQLRRIAAIDLGTNTTLMLVAEVDAANALKTLEDRATITRLGRGVDRTGQLDVAAIERTLDVLRGYAEIAARWGAPIVAVGTSALRDASNREAFLKPARALLGSDVQAIEGAREAALTFMGALEGIDVGQSRITVVDIGGGSTEIITGVQRTLLDSVSLDVGSVRMHERFALDAPVTHAQERALREAVRSILRASPVHPTPRLLAIAGTATTLAAMARDVDPYDPARVHGQSLTLAEVHAQAERLLRSSMVERRHMRGLHPDRADVIAAGAVILQELMVWCGAREVVVSDGGVRFGLAREALENSPIDPDPPTV